jgi:hypothetical protein
MTESGGHLRKRVAPFSHHLAVIKRPLDDQECVQWVTLRECSQEFLSEAVQNRSGKNEGRRSIWFNGRKINKATGRREEYCKPPRQKYLTTDFSRLRWYARAPCLPPTLRTLAVLFDVGLHLSPT